MCGMSMLGLAFLTASTFFAPLEHEFHWTRTQTTSSFLVYAGASVFMAPLVGTVLDKVGVRRLALPGCALVGIAWALFATLNGSLVQWLFLWLLVAAASQAVAVTVWSAAIASYFTVSRGLALAFTMGANGVTQLVAPNLTNLAIETQGWRIAFVVVGLGWGAAVTLVCFFLLKDSRGAATSAHAPAAAAGTPLTGYTVGEGVRSASFVKIILGVFISYLVIIGLMVHLVPLLGSRGLSRNEAVLIYSTLGITGGISNIAAGYLVDRLPAKPLTAFLIALPAVACLLLLQPSTSFWQRAIAAHLFGIAAGGHLPPVVYIATRYFGLRSFGTLFGFVGSAMAVPSALAPFLAGVLFDRTHSYVSFLWVCIPLALLGALIVLSLGRYPEFPAEAEAPSAAAPLPA
jgi:MFS family permease